MTRLSTHVLLTAGLGLVAVFAGCTSPNPDCRSYCDETGCYQCEPGGDCQAVPNAPCTSTATCPAGQACTSVGCAEACTAASPCAGGFACVMGYCVPGGFNVVKPVEGKQTCDKDGDCAVDMHCVAKTCIPRCKSDDDCAPGLVCVACGKCQKPSLPATCGEVPDYCNAKVSCGAGKVCQEGRCHVACDSKTACPVGQVCDKGACVDDPSPTSPECVLDLDCADGACVNGYCHVGCQSSGECGSQELCLVGICQPDYHPAH